MDLFLVLVVVGFSCLFVVLCFVFPLAPFPDLYFGVDSAYCSILLMQHQAVFPKNNTF